MPPKKGRVKVKERMKVKEKEKEMEKGTSRGPEGSIEDRGKIERSRLGKIKRTGRKTLEIKWKKTGLPKLPLMQQETMPVGKPQENRRRCFKTSRISRRTGTWQSKREV